MIDIYVSIRILEKSCRYLRRWLHKKFTSINSMFFYAVAEKSTKKNLIVQTRTEKYAYALDKELHLEFEGLIGKSRIAVSGGKAWFEDSPCDNKICVESGKITGPNQWAACLPNGIIIYIEGETEKEEVDVIAN